MRVTASASDPASTNLSQQIVLDEKREEVKLNSTVNQIFIKAIDRTTRAMIFMANMAPPADNLLPYKKVMRYYQMENKIFAVVSYEAAKKIPLVE